MNNNSVQSIIRAFSILNLLCKYHQGLGVSAISEKLDLNISTTHRILKTLIDCKAVVQSDGNRHYYLSPSLMSYGKAVLNRFDFIQDAHPLLGELSKEISETVFMGILDEDELVYIDHVDSLSHILRMPAQIGRRQAAYSTALGKAILAFLPKEKLEYYLQSIELHSFTQSTINDLKDLRVALEFVRQAGYAIDREESETGICCVSAPIFNQANEVVAAISTSGPSTRMEMKGLDTSLKENVINTARKISNLIII